MPPIVPPIVAPVPIDPDRSDAKEQIHKAFPRVDVDAMRLASDEEERLASTYLQLQAQIRKLCEEQERIGNRLKLRIGVHRGIERPGIRVTWAMREGLVSYGALCKSLQVPDEMVEKYRGPQSRALDVRRTA